ncbi:MAG TPA: serine/threonine-protein kinase [Rhodanobacteraceae bacterium]|nr:serine/threonine-protein kinase [Rhodanobacteraceae bacterium]
MPADNNRPQGQHGDGRERDGLEQVAARIADEQPVNWRDVVDETDAASLSGLREIEQLAQGFRHLQVSAIAPKTPASNKFRFGNLQVLEPLGTGTQGDVWRAYDPLLDLQVALKLRKVDSDTLSHQFLEEARRLARVRQANIVSVYGAAVHDGRAGLWTELVRGSPLADLLAAHGPFPADEVRGIGLDLCHALAAVHRHGLVHGDVKAENVMREVSGRIVLMDFGAAREFEHADASVVSGTLRYLAPEVLRGAAPSPASDLYALGVLLFHLLSDAYPYAASDLDGLLAAQERNQRARLTSLKKNVPADLVRAIEQAIDPNPARRHASALAFATALAPRAARNASKSWGLLAAVAAVVALLAGIVAWRSGVGGWQAQVEFQRVGAHGGAALADGASIAMGDRLVLQFRSSQPAFVYIFDDDGSGATGVLFPLTDVEPANPLAANTPYRLPGKQSGEAVAWTVSSHAEREEFVIVAATSAQPELERAIADWQRAGANKAGTARGALGLTSAPEETDIASAPLRQILQRLKRDGQDNQMRQWRFVFPHADR